jgi:hypothetical protein
MAKATTTVSETVITTSSDTAQLARVNAVMATNLYSVQGRIMQEVGADIGLGSISFKATYSQTREGADIVANDSDYINNRQLHALKEAIGNRGKRFNSKYIRVLKVGDSKQPGFTSADRGFAIPNQVIVLDDNGNEVQRDGRQVIAWSADENPLRQVEPAPMLRQEQVWVTVHFFDNRTSGELTIVAFFAPIKERTRSEDFVIERPKLKPVEA